MIFSSVAANPAHGDKEELTLSNDWSTVSADSVVIATGPGESSSLWWWGVGLGVFLVALGVVLSLRKRQRDVGE